MEKEEIFVLTEQIKQVCPPECNLRILQTKQQDEVYLVIIQFPSTDGYLPTNPLNIPDWNLNRLQSIFTRDPYLKKAYNWEKQKIHNFHNNVILPLVTRKEHFRFVYHAGGIFVFYPHVFGCMQECPNAFNYIGMNDFRYFKYFGNCRNIDWLVGFLISTFKKF